MLQRLWLGLRSGARAVAYQVAEAFGEHDYDRYVATWNARHVGQTPTAEHRPMSAREFFDWRVERKYGGGFSRC
ncbi:MAG TPA: YbdD/YjiX family protein [Chloroflexota bacterium]|jgi:uncharacterized short protein YbdD (DUF466 family)